MFTQYIDNIKSPDSFERTSKLFLAPASTAFGRQIDVRTGLTMPRHPTILRIIAAAAAIFLVPITLLGLALQTLSVTYNQHARSFKTSFKPIALVVAEPNWNEVNRYGLLDDVIAASLDIGQHKPKVVVWDSGKNQFLQKSETHKDTELSALDLSDKHTVILLSVTPPAWRVFNVLRHDGYFSSCPSKIFQQGCDGILYQSDRISSLRGSSKGYETEVNGKNHSYLVDSNATIPWIVKEILEQQS